MKQGRQRKAWRGGALAAALVVSGALQAAAPAADDVRLNCGGIGVDESSAMRADAARHALTILFTAADGHYLSDVQTRVEDPLGDRRVELACGPIGQVDVTQPGRYRVVATYGERTQTRWFELKPGGGAKTTLRWTE